MLKASRARPNIRSVEMIRMLVASGKTPRVAMSGTSMLPLLREPMILKLKAPGKLRVGNIIAFERRGAIVAHRIISVKGDVVRTAGDATPETVETVEPASLVGMVVAIYANGSARARRVDGLLFRAVGQWMAHSRRLRCAWLRLGRAYLENAPWRRARSFSALVDLMTALQRGDAKKLAIVLWRADPHGLAETARRHRCAGLLLDGIRKVGRGDWNGHPLTVLLQPVTRATVLRSFALREEVAAVCKVLASRSIDVALLKGAARLYARAPDAELHPADDLDVFVKPQDLDAAVGALKAAGYLERADAGQSAAYRARHHHAAPLHHPGRRVPIELHVSLAPPGAVSLQLDWNALAPHMVFVDGPAGPVRCLDPFASALHLAVHAVGLLCLRDCAALASILKSEAPGLRAALDETVRDERIEPIRLRASIAMAGRLAGFPARPNDDVRRYLAWVARREDLPRSLRTRSQLVEAWFAAGRRLRHMRWAIVAPERLRNLKQQREDWRGPARIAARLFTAPFAALLPLARGERSAK